MNEELKALIEQINGGNPTFAGSIRAVEQTDQQKAAGDEPLFELSFSSEDPYERWFGVEVLGHKSAEVRMDWLKSGNAPLLNQHNHDEQIGVIEKATLSGGRGTAVVRFGKSALAEEVKKDVEAGIRRNVSVGYRVHEMVLVQERDDAPSEYRVTDWEPFEVSIVSVPADRSVGTNRRAEPALNQPIHTKETNMKPEELKAEALRLGLSPDASLKAVMDEQRKQAEAAGKSAADAANAKELSRINSIRQLADVHKDRIGDVAARAEAAINGRTSLDDFRREILDCYTAGTAVIKQPGSDFSKQEKKDLSGFSIVKAIRVQAAGRLTGIEAEVHQMGEKEARDSGLTVSGFAIPSSVMQRDLTYATESGDMVDTTMTGFIGLLRNKMMVKQLGARMLTGLTSNILIPKMTAGATAAWEGENDAGSEQTQTFGQLALTANRVGAYTEVSKKLILQSTPDVEMLVRDDLATAIALAIDSAALHGTGTNDQPTGIAATSGIGSVVGDTNGAAPDWADIVNLESAVAVDNADNGALAYCTNAVVRGKLKQTAKVASTDSRMVWADGEFPLNGYRCGVTNQVSSSLTKGTASGTCSAIFFGNWNDLIVAQFGGLDLVVDPYSLATTNLLRITANTYADVGVRHAESFAAMLDALTA